VLVGLGGAIGLSVDGFSQTFKTIFVLGAFLSILMSFKHLDSEDAWSGEYTTFITFSLFGMMVMASGMDLLTLWVGLETMALCIYVLAGYLRRREHSVEGGMKYFLLGAFSSGLYLYGASLIYGATGTVNLVKLNGIVGSHLGHLGVPLGTGILLLSVGVLFKAALVPFHWWTPDAYEGAPTPVTGFMAAGVKAAGFAAIIRFLTIELAPATEFWEGIVWWLAMLTMIVPNLAALAQDDVKRMLAYSSIAHAGYLLVGVAADSPLGRSATLFYLAVYAVMTLGSFAIVYIVAGKGDIRSKLSDFRGLGWRRPLLGLSLVVFLLSLAGFPPTGGFIGKLYLLSAAVESGERVLAITLVLTSLISYYYYLRVIWKMYFEEAPETLPTPERPGLAFGFAATVGVLALLAAGLFPGHALRTASRAGEQLVPRASVMVPGTAPSTRPAPPQPAPAGGSPDVADPER
ncbi:MAG: NADH-quinone oxidoreductase subunit N, partial [Gemmatimonadota bacterium]